MGLVALFAACEKKEAPVTGAAAPAAPAAPAKEAADTGPIKVGILHSLSGTMAISETSLKDVALMAIEELNDAGGVLGRKVEPVVVDPASNWPLFAEKARDLISNQKVAVTFGCWTSVSRKSVLPVFEELNGLLFYPVQYEGEESSFNVFYTDAAPNQQAIPAVEYLMTPKGGGAKRFVLLGTDYVYPRTTNKILQYFLASKGVKKKDIQETYTPFGHADYQTIVADIKKFAAGKRTGPWKAWFDSGQLQSEGNFAGDLQDGPWTLWFANGQMQAKGTFVAGVMEGAWEGWNEDGTPDVNQSGTYKQGAKVPQ